MTWSVLRPTPAPVPVVIGTVADFPPGSITKLDLAATFNDTMRPPPTRFILEGHPWYRRMSMIAQERWEQQFPPIVGQRMPVPVIIVHDEQRGLLALYNRDTHSSCQIFWFPNTSFFSDPCHGATYTYTGAYVRGPAPRSLDRFGVTVNKNGEVLVDVKQFTKGEAAP